MKRFSKHLSVILAVAMLFSCFVMYAPTASAETEIWDGKTITVPSGKGTASEPYLISNGEELAWMVMSYGGNNYFTFVDDVYLNDVDKINWQTGEAEEGYTINPWFNRTQAWQIFNGKVNGNGHVIYGLYTNDQTQFAEGSGGFGLFPVCGNVTINGLGIDKAYLEGYTMYSLGAFAGYGQGSLKGSMENCYVGADVTIKGKDAGAFVGGGDIASMFTIKNCYSLATLSYTRRGGLVGDSWTSEYTFENVYCLGSALANSVAKATNCYSTIGGTGLTQVAAENMKGKATDGNALILGDAFVATEGYPTLKVFTENPNSTAWNGLAERPAGGDGTSMANAYEISTVGQLAFLVGQGWGNAKLVNDIYINELDKIDWTTGEILDENYIPTTWFYGTDNGAAYYKGFGGSKSFSGNFDGNGFTIHGLYYPASFDKITAGLFPGGSSATIKNLHLSNSFVVGGRFIGAISSTFSGTMNNVVVDHTVTVKQKRNLTTESFSVGGLIGYSNGVTLNNCASSANLSGDSHKYGLIGTSWGTKINATNCFSFGEQPFTTSIGSKTFSGEADAEAYYANMYQATNVYTNANKRANTVSYKIGDESKSYEVFTFTVLEPNQMQGKDALTNMPGLSSDVWYTTDGVPKTKLWATTVGDNDLDGFIAVSGDMAEVRKAIIGAENTGCTDFNRSGTTDLYDLVLVARRSLKLDGFNYTYRANGYTYTLESVGNLADYVIVYAAGNNEGKAAAEALQALYKAQGINVAITTDASAEVAKEILIGKTNRGLHEEGLLEGAFTIKVVGEKIQFSASDELPAALKTAVAVFEDLSVYGFAAETEGWHEYEGGSVTLATNMTNWAHSDKRNRTYTYVWGDEFYGDTLNPNKWVCTTGSSKMSGYSDLTILSTKEAVNVNGGSLNLIAGQREDGSFFAPASVHTQGTMEYRYGYVEMRAKIPYRVGVWPSFWMQSAATLGGRQNYDYMVEVDMLEVFGHTSDLYCNVHKWYSSAKQEQYGVRNIAAAEDGGVSGWLSQLFGKPVGEEKRTVKNPEEWHTYGFAWDANYMCMYVDRELFRVYDITSAKTVFGSDNVKKTDSDMSGFHDPLYIIFNNHVFTPGANFKPGQINGYESNLPATYEIDYVRLYQGTETNTQLWTK